MLGRLALVVLVLLFAAPAAEAKAPPDVRLCGANGCIQIAQRDAEQLSLWHVSGPVAPGAPSAFYVFRYRWGPTDLEQTAYWLPSRNLVRFVNSNVTTWYRISSASIQPFAGGLTPFPVARITGVTVGGRAVRAPGTYLRLLGAGRASDVFPAVRWLTVRFTANGPSPWTDASANVRISSAGAWLLRDDTVFVIPKRVADRARRGLPLT